MTDVRQLAERLKVFSKDDLVLELIGALCRSAELAEALKPFSDVAQHDIGEDEADADLFKPIRHNRAPLLTVGDFRRSFRLVGISGGQGERS